MSTQRHKRDHAEALGLRTQAAEATVYMAEGLGGSRVRGHNVCHYIVYLHACVIRMCVLVCECVWACPCVCMCVYMYMLAIMCCAGHQCVCIAYICMCGYVYHPLTCT